VCMCVPMSISKGAAVPPLPHPFLLGFVFACFSFSLFWAVILLAVLFLFLFLFLN